MKFKDILKKYGAYAVAVLVFLALAYAYCMPQLQGKVLITDDQQNFAGAVHESEVYHQKTGDYTFWNASMFSGMPNYQIGGGHYTSYTLMAPVNYVFNRYGNPAWLIFIYFLCFFICLLCFDVNKWLSLVGAIAIGLSSYFLVIIGAGHLTKTVTIATTAVVLGAFNLIFSKKKYVLGAILTMLFVAVGATKHPQMFYYYFMLIGLMWIIQLIVHLKEKKWRDLLIGTAVFALSVGIGLGANSSDVFANAEYTKETIRGGHSDLDIADKPVEDTPTKGLDLKYATEYSYGIGESLSFLIPGVYGGSSTTNVGTKSEIYKQMVTNGVSRTTAQAFAQKAPVYWGKQPFTAGNVYMGAIICFLFLLGCMIVPGPQKWGFLIGTVLSILLSWGNNFMWLTRLFFNVFPLYNKFRSVSSILIIAEVCMPILGILAIKEIIQGNVDKKELRKNIYWAGGLTCAICLMLGLMGSHVFSFVSPNDAKITGGIPAQLYEAIKDYRMELLRKDAFRSAGFIAAAAVTLWVYSTGKLKSGVLVAILGVLVLFDMWPVDKRYFNDNNFGSPRKQSATFQMYPYEEALLQDPDPDFRVLNLTVDTYNESRTSYFLKSVGGYHAAKLRRYQDIIDQHLRQLNSGVVNMLNTKYLILKDDDGEPTPQYNPGAMGHAWFVSNFMLAKDPNQECAALSNVDLHRTAIVGQDFADFVPNPHQAIDPNATVVLTAYSPKSLDYKVKSANPGTVVFSEIYYPYGWKATIDGHKADYFRADYILRAINVPSGTHYINFTFDPDSVRLGNILSSVCIILMYLAVVLGAGWGIFTAVRKKKALAE